LANELTLMSVLAGRAGGIEWRIGGLIMFSVLNTAFRLYDPFRAVVTPRLMRRNVQLSPMWAWRVGGHLEPYR
jgi:hypothetical protein